MELYPQGSSVAPYYPNNGSLLPNAKFYLRVCFDNGWKQDPAGALISPTGTPYNLTNFCLTNLDELNEEQKTARIIRGIQNLILLVELNPKELE